MRAAYVGPDWYESGGTARRGAGQRVQTETVLLVEDDPVERQALAEYLAGSGYRVVACGAFSEAFQALRQSPPAALIVDIRLSGYNGLQLALYAAAHYPWVRRIAISGYDDPVLRRVAAHCGTPFFLKPLDLRALVTRLSLPPAPVIPEPIASAPPASRPAARASSLFARFRRAR